MSRECIEQLSMTCAVNRDVRHRLQHGRTNAAVNSAGARTTVEEVGGSVAREVMSGDDSSIQLECAQHQAAARQARGDAAVQRACSILVLERR
jgi:hypothetical protein